MVNELEKNYLLWLSRIKNISLKKKLDALGYFKNAKTIFNIQKQDFIDSRIFSLRDIENIIKNQNENLINEYLLELSKHKMKFTSISCEEYPFLLKNIYDPPIILYYYGILPKPNSINISIVGTRNSTAYGKEITYDLTKNLSQNNICIVSGMANGIDSVAHLGVIENVGTTIAVLGNGVDICYPSNNINLRNKIIENGAIISEYPPGTNPISYNFPERNRIISGLSVATVVVEAPKKSGALITADFALNQGRDVFAYPGNVLSKNSTGTNELIKDGANLITSYEDILNYYDIIGDNKIKNKKLQIHNKKIDNLSDIEKNIYSIITIEGITIDLIVNKTNINLDSAISTLTSLEILGLIKRIPGQKFALKI